MLRRFIDDASPPVVGGFRHRGHHHVSRIESFSDAVFAFALTLLVVSLSVPQTFDELLATMAGFPAFAVSFALLAQIWYYQYVFFRRYALNDRTTIVLNIALLFVVVFYTYPLKFLFGVIFGLIKGGTPALRPEQLWQLMAVYGAGYATMFFLFMLMHAHALRVRDVLELSPLEVLDTRLAITMSWLQIAVAALSVAVAYGFSTVGQYALAGFCGGMLYPIALTLGAAFIKRGYRRNRAAVTGATQA